ncbi:MAG TPA: VWA domain-containing protein [Methylococcaceae bacterium]|nr:VWA domain-containing protein [Methylococcaceae bacterium]
MKAIFLSLLALLMGMAGAATAQAENNVLFILDASGSMKKMAGHESRMDAAKRVLADTLRDMPKEARLGLMAYGHRRGKDCTDIELLAPIGADDAARIGVQIQAMQPRGETPIAGALEQAARSFAALKGQSNSIVLVTDGIEECKGDPCAAAKAVAAAGLDLKVSVVGFTLDRKQRQAIECVANETGGKYYDAGDAKALSAALAQVREQVAKEAPPPEEFNLLAPRNGGQLLAAPEEEWKNILTGNEKDQARVAVGTEAIFAFKDEAPARFDKFTILIPAGGPYIKEFELLAADEMAGPYRSVGTFATQNLRLLRTPYQEFKFAETTARYLKLRLISAHDRTTGGFHLLTQVRLVGKPEAAGTAQPAAPAAAAAVDLLAAANGGRLLAAPEEEWKNIVTGREQDQARVDAGTEAIFGFKEGRPATFGMFSMLVPASGPYIKDFELFAADEMDGPYRSLGRFATQNARLMRSPYQDFKLPETTARYVKLKLLSAHDRTTGGFHLLSQVRLLGTLDMAPGAARPEVARTGANLVAAANGGQILAAPDDEWKNVVTGREQDQARVYLGKEAIFAFKDEQAAAIEAFGLLIPASGPYIKDFEVLVADDLNGPYRSLGQFATRNLRLMQNPYQVFAFAPVTVRYVKLKLVSAHGTTTGGFHLLNQVQVLGPAK